MSFIGGGFSVGTGPSSAMRFAQTRGRIHGSPVQGVNYPSPFFDIAHTYLPVTVKQLFRWCRYYFLTNPLINATVFKLSEYPITDVIIDHEDPEVVKRWTEYFQDHLNYRPFQIECGLDYHAYGNSMVSIGFPFRKYLHCQSCGFAEQAQKIRSKWVFTNYTFRLTCPGCGITADAWAEDRYFKNASGIKLIRWNCEHVDVTYNDVTGESTYFYNIPSTVRNDIVIGKKDVVESVPQVFIQALRQQKGVVFSKDNFFHLKRPTLAQQDRGWGIPMVLPVLKDTFHLQLMKKAQEAILVEHIVPLRVLFPQAGSGSSDPYSTINLVDWRDQIAAEIARWRHDNNYIPILPLPIGNQTIGGDGRALLLSQEIQQWGEHIMVGMGVPREFLLGGMSYAGTNVSMRMLENQFIGFILRHKQMAKWIMRMVASRMDWPEVNIRFKPFKMADDLQRKAYLYQLNQAQKISDKSLLADSDFNQTEEDEMMVQETATRLEATKKQQLAMAEIQAEAQVIMAKSQVKANQVMMDAQGKGIAPGEPGGPRGPMDEMQSQLHAQQSMSSGMGAQQPGMEQGGQVNIDLQQMAQSLAQQISSLAPQEQEMAIQNLQQQSPELAQMVQQMLKQMQPEQSQQASAGVDMRPLPEQLPARRDAQLV